MPNTILDYASPKRTSFFRVLSAALAATLLMILVTIGVSESTHAHVSGGPSPEHSIAYLREQIEAYRADHGAPPEEHFLFAQLLHASNKKGLVKAGPPTPDFPFGPYCQDFVKHGYLTDATGKFPVNGWTTKSAKVAATPAPDVGWVYTVHGYNFKFQLVNLTGDGVDDNW